MRKIIGAVILILVSCGVASATTVTATVTDPRSVPYANALYSIAFVPAPGQLPSAYLVNGSTFPGRDTPLTGVLNSSGVLSVTVTDSTTISPNNSSWAITIISANQTNSFTTAPIVISGSSMSLTTVLSAAATSILGGVVAINPTQGVAQSQITLDQTSGQTAPALAYKKTDGTTLFSINADGSCTGCGGGGTAGGTNGQVQYNNSGAFGGFTFSGDSTLVPSTGVMTNTGINGVEFSTLATGIVKNTTVTGAPSIAAQSDILAICVTCVTSSAALTNNAVVIGGGLQASSTISADTTTTHALFATASAPAFRAIAAGDIPTAIPIANIGSAGLSGTSPIVIGSTGAISCSTCNTTAATVTSASFTGGLISVGAPTTTPAFTVAGTSGGMPYFSGTATWASSALLTQFGVLFGGGAGGAPTSSAQGGSNFPLIGQGASNPIFSTIAYPTSLTSGGFLYASSTTAFAGSALLATGTVPKSGGAGSAPIASSAVDNGTTYAISEPVTGTSFAAGTSPPICTPGTSGAACYNEGTAPTGTASVDMIYANSTSHCLDALNNNVDVGCIATISQVAAVQSCGTTTTCSHTALTTPQIVLGSAALVSGTPSTATITGISPAFTSSTSYRCTVTAQSAAATALLSVANVSGSSFTITGPATVTTVINYICAGN